MSAEAATVIDQESETVHEWRYQRFLALGFEDCIAALFAYTGGDYHKAERLLEMGCSHALVVDILA